MKSTRSYGQGCAAAHALDLVGERWALLVIRELLLGPKRFTDLRAGLAHASPNVLAQRLRELEGDGIVRRRKLGPPAGSWVYELTDWGRELEPVILSLGRWGARSPFRPRAEVGVDAVLIALKALFDPDAAGDLDARYALHIGDDRYSAQVTEGRIDVSRGEEREPDATIDTDHATFTSLLTKALNIDEAARKGRVKLTGDKKAVSRLFDAIHLPEPISVI